MAHSLSAKKRIRQNLKHRDRNRRRVRLLKGGIKQFLTSVHDGKTEEAQKQLSGLTKLIDQIAAKGTIHRNAAARYKSRLTVRLNHLRKTKAAAPAA